MPVLSIQSGPDQGLEFPFEHSIVIGRGGTADFVVPDASVSRRHALVALEEGHWGVQDLDSGNGTFVNDRRISQRALLAPGDSLRLGAVVLAYREGTGRDTGPPTMLPSAVADAAGEAVVLRVTAEAAEEASRAGAVFDKD